MKKLLGSFPNVDYRKMLHLLEGLQTRGLVQETKVANLQSKARAAQETRRTQGKIE
jgi:hypothetical protein